MTIPSQGSPSPLGFSIQGNKSNFALYSQNATQVTLGLFLEGKQITEREFPMHRTGDVWHLCLEDLPPNLIYAFRCQGSQEDGNLFNGTKWLSDPYSKVPESPFRWGDKTRQYRAHPLSPLPFDWEDVLPPKIPFQDLIIYEMHVRGFTQHASSKVEHPGTFLGVLEKIPHLKSLGINAVELMPIFEFDEIHSKDMQPQTGELLPNYWGYNSLFFFAPMRRFAASEEPLAPINEFKMLVKELHRNGIEVILDVVYNHTGEGNEKNYFVHFRGIDNKIYYMVDPHGHYRNFTGCGNTFNCNHPVVQQFILDSLSYWIEEMKIDGFRFDLASIFTRDLDGTPLESPPIVQAITDLCKAKGVKLIAEAWDAGGLYQVGLFPSKWGSWSDWNGKYRDTIRRFIKGTPGQVGALADMLTGSHSVYHASGTPISSLNFITAHDGYCLRDLVTYQMKHNYENGEMNQDGANQNDNWNCGAEGPTLNAQIAFLREKQMRNFFLALLLSQGIPMLLMGDEYGHSRRGNNNPFVQDNELNWFLWNLLPKNKKIFSFVSSLIAFRKRHSCLRSPHFLTPKDIQWHGTTPLKPNWNFDSQFIAFTLTGKTPLYIAFNAHNHPVTITLPSQRDWKKIVNTDEDWDKHHLDKEDEAPVLSKQIILAPYSSLLAK